MGDGAWALVQHLADRRLVVTGRDEVAGTETVEVVHEALIGNWEQLQGWMAEDRSFRTWQERLRVAVRTWESTERDEGALLRGAPLAEAEGWLAGRADEIGSAEREYIDAAVSLRQQREQEREAQRRRELEAAEQLAEQRRLSAARLRRRAVYLSLALLMALTAAGLAGVFGRRSANLAEDNARIAEQESLARATAQAESGARGTAQAQEAAQRVRAEDEAAARATAQAQTELQREEALRQAAIGLASEATLQMQGPDQDLAVLLAVEAVEHYPYTWQAELALAEIVRDFRLVRELRHDIPVGAPTMLSPDGTRFLTTANDGVLRVWDLESGGCLLTVQAYEVAAGNYHWAVWSPPGDRILTLTRAELPRIWDAKTGALVAELAGHGGRLAEWSPDGAQVLTSNSTQEDAAIVWDSQTGQVVRTLPGDRGFLQYASYSADGEWIATSVGQIWDAQTGEIAHTLAEYQDLMTGDTQLWLHWSPDGALLGAGIGDSARVWKASTGDEVLALETGYRGNVDLWWSPGGDRILTTGASGMGSVATLWDAATGERLRQLPHFGEVQSILMDPWSPEGDRVLLVDEQDHVIVWDAASGRELLRLSTNSAAVYATWLPDGSGFITTGDDGKVRFWRISTAELEVGCSPDCSYGSTDNFAYPRSGHRTGNGSRGATWTVLPRCGTSPLAGGPSTSRSLTMPASRRLPSYSRRGRQMAVVSPALPSTVT